MRYAIYGVAFGFVFPLIAWTIDIIIEEIPLKGDELWEMHIDNPVLFIVDLAPIVLAALFHILYKKSEKIERRLQKIITERNKIIEQNSEFAKKIGEGDFSKELQVAKNDILGNSLIMMRKNLIATNKRESEQNWITKGKEQIGDILRYHNNLEELAYATLVSLVNYTNSVQGAFYIYDRDTKILTNIAIYAYNRRKFIKQEFKIGQGLVGQAAYEKEIIYRKEIPSEYTTISSGVMNDQKPKTILLSPLIGDEKLQGVLEFASFQEEIPDQSIRLVEEISGIIAQTVFNLQVNTRTENLLGESRSMTKRLQKNEDELRKNAEEMQSSQIEIEKANKNLASQIEEVEKSRKRLYSLLENASEVISIYDENGIVTYESPSIKHILGYNPEELIGRSGFKKYDEAANKKLKKAFYDLIENSNRPITLEYQYKKTTGEILWLETTGRNLLHNLAINGIIFNTRDITVRKVAEKAQRMSGQMEALSENSLDMIVRINPDGQFFYVNPTAEKFTGVGKRNIVRKTLDQVEIHNDIIIVFRDALTKVLQTHNKFDTETIFPNIDSNEERIVQFNAIPEFNEENELETILFIVHDITEQKQIQLEIEEKNKSITESINYAQRIQSAIVPSTKHILQHIPKCFIFYKPRDIVSGDIPWFLETEDFTYIAAVDCTGHGVPGALLSFIGYFLLNNIVSTQKEFDAGNVLDALHEGVRKTLKQDNPDADARDGMDIALCKIDYKNNILDYSGAHRPLYYLEKDAEELKQYKGTSKAIGGRPTKRKKKEKDFQNHKISYKQGDKIFFFSDGLPDQIGGEKGRKYKPSRIREVIIDNRNFTMSQFENYFDKDLSDWKENYKQIDDILMMGIEF